MIRLYAVGTSVFVVININIMLYRNKILHNRATHFVDRTFLSCDYLYHNNAYYSSGFNEMYNAFNTYNNNTATKFRTALTPCSPARCSVLLQQTQSVVITILLPAVGTEETIMVRRQVQGFTCYYLLFTHDIDRNLQRNRKLMHAIDNNCSCAVQSRNSYSNIKFTERIGCWQVYL